MSLIVGALAASAMAGTVVGCDKQKTPDGSAAPAPAVEEKIAVPTTETPTPAAANPTAITGSDASGAALARSVGEKAMVGGNPAQANLATPSPAQPNPTDSGVADKSFTIALQMPAETTSGKPVTGRVTITPGAGLKMNHEFPNSLKMAEVSGVAYAQQDQGRPQAKVDTEKELSFDVTMTPAAAGVYNATGIAKFAVCDDTNCIPKKQSIAFALRVK